MTGLRTARDLPGGATASSRPPQRRAGRSRLPVLRDHGGGDRSRPRRCASAAIRPFRATTPIWTTACSAVLPGCLRRGTRIITNQGWINPEGAAQRIVHWLREFGARGVTVAAVIGRPDHRSRARADRHDHGEWAAHLDAARRDRVGRGLHGRGADRCGAQGKARRSSLRAAWPTRRSSWRR